MFLRDSLRVTRDRDLWHHGQELELMSAPISAQWLVFPGYKIQ